MRGGGRSGGATCLFVYEGGRIRFAALYSPAKNRLIPSHTSSVSDSLLPHFFTPMQSLLDNETLTGAQIKTLITELNSNVVTAVASGGAAAAATPVAAAVAPGGGSVAAALAASAPVAAGAAAAAAAAVKDAGRKKAGAAP